RIAGAAGAAQGVLSFEPHPRSFFRPAAPPFRLTPFRAKTELLRRLGVDLLFSLRFDRRMASRPAEKFVRDILVGGLAIRHAVVGYDFVFGHGRQGSAALLTRMGEELGFDVTVVDPVRAEA